MNVLEGNRIIAEFMGAKFEPEWRFLTNLDNPIEPTWVFEVAPTQHSCKNWSNESLQYHESWEWLMPVVEKIENLEFSRGVYLVKIEGNYCSISIHDETEWLICESDLVTSKIDAVWQTVVKFIQNHV